MRHDLILFNGIIINENRRFVGYVVIDGDTITDVADGIPSEQLLACADAAVDVGDAYILPGVIDDQVHFRDPGLTHKGRHIYGVACGGGRRSHLIHGHA